MQLILSETGQITLPESIQQAMHIQPGDALEIMLDDQGDLKLKPVVAANTPPGNKLQAFLQSGFVGCGSGPEDGSVN